MRGGDTWDAAIRQQIKACALFVPLISSNSRVAIDTALHLDPLDLLEPRYFARLFYYRGRLTEAESTIRQILAANPTFSAAHYELGRILLGENRIDEAVTAFEAEPNPAWRDLGLPLGYFAQGRRDATDAAFEWLDRASVRNPDAVAQAQ